MTEEDTSAPKGIVLAALAGATFWIVMFYVTKLLLRAAGAS